MRTRCGFTGKVMFKTEKGALNRGIEITQNKGNHKYCPDKFRAYLCEYCGKFHITGKPLD